MIEKELKILVLDGCEYCKKLKEELEGTGRHPVYIDANKEDKLADYVEGLLDTYTYPIAIITKPDNTYFIFRPDKEKHLGRFNIGPNGSANNIKIGCLTIRDMVSTIQEIIKS